jgi:atypical dual specificity phosphatase
MVVMRGEQYHHNNPSVLVENLYLCAARAISSKMMHELGITCVINATIELPTYAYQKQECMQIAVEDRVSAKLHVYFDMVADKIHSVLNNGGTLLIYCRAGMSRSATLCIAYFMKYNGMNLEEAYQFVRERRPIIHPNIGFMSQLRKYETKLELRKSGVKRKFEEDDITFADLAVIHTEDEAVIEHFDELTVIMPRPKPRIMKPKPVDPKLAANPLECAQSYEIAEIQFCLEDPLPSAAAPPPPTPTLATSIRKMMPSHSTKSRHRGQGLASRPTLSRPISMPAVRPQTPVVIPTTTTSNWTFHDPMGVAVASEAIPMEATTPGVSSSRTSSSKKRPFIRISEPAKVAVSFQTFHYGLCAPFDKGQKVNFQTEVPYYSVFADAHLPMASQSQEVSLECPISGVSKAVTNGYAVVQLLTNAKAVVTQLRCSPVSVLTLVIMDCPGVFQNQKVDGLGDLPVIKPKPKPQPQPKVPSRFSGLSRTSATRSSIKMTGLKITPIPESHRKRPLPMLDLEFRQVASNYQSPIIFERLETNLKKQRPPTYGVARQILWCPDNCVASVTTFKEQIFEKAETDTILGFKVAWHLTVPRRTVILATHAVTVGKGLALILEDILPPEKSTMPNKEYPYYSPVRKTSMILEMMRATVIPKVELSWLSALAVVKKPVQPVHLVTKPDTEMTPVVVNKPPPAQPVSARQPVTKITEIMTPALDTKPVELYEPELHWATSRCEYDPSSIPLEIKPLVDLLLSGKAKPTIQKSLLDTRYRSAACKILDHTTYQEEPENIPRVKMPEMYKTFTIMRINFYPLYETATSSMQESCMFLNLYTPCTPFKAWAKQMTHVNVDTSNVDKSPQQDYLHVATCQMTTSNDSMSDLAEIPDVVGDISQIQPLLAAQRDPAKMVIWLEVFKRSVMKARPIYPFVGICEMLPVATSRHVMMLCDSSNFTKVHQTIPTVRALYTTVTEPTLVPQPIVQKKSRDFQYAIEVVDCFRADVIHTLNPLIMKIRAISQREKAIESTEYIRDYTVTNWPVPMEENEVQSWTKAPALKYNTSNATVIISMPLSIAMEDKAQVFGCLEDHPYMAGQSVIHWLARKPFKKVTQLKQIAVVAKELPLVGYKQLPKYEFVQDIEESPDVSIQGNETSENRFLKVNKPVDTFWFFQMDTPKVEKKVFMDLSHLGASATMVDDEPVPIAAPGSFQLFLPDPEMMDRLGQVPAEEIFVKKLPINAVSVDDDDDDDDDDPNIPVIPAEVLPVIVTTDCEDLIQGSVKDRRQRSRSGRRVIIADPPVSGSKSPPRSPRPKSSSRMFSYQRPREQSRNTRLALATKDVNTRVEKKAMADLQASMRNASELLDRRRAAGSSRYESTLQQIPLVSERGRTTSRYSTPSASSSTTYYTSSTATSSRSSTATTPTTSASTSEQTPASGPLWGLLDMAQSWIMNHRSRRDRSEEKAKYLLRRSRQL